VFSGVNSVVIEFHTSDGRHGAELMEFAKNGRVARVIAITRRNEHDQKDTPIESTPSRQRSTARRVGAGDRLFAAAATTIESLTAETAPRTPRAAVVTSGTPAVISRSRCSWGRLVPVHRVVDITTERPGIEREMAL
jgi:hypothetical protein